ncbi:hypothetical protein M758_9G120500 [Ceratodon purpureus]|nr:hypothetical protein M758_9G120500 [Ceratodon purpureus]
MNVHNAVKLRHSEPKNLISFNIDIITTENVSMNIPTTRQSMSKPSHSDVRIDHCKLDRRPPNSINRQRSKPTQISKSKFHSPNPEPDHNEFAAHADASVGCSPASTYPS